MLAPGAYTPGTYTSVTTSIASHIPPLQASALEEMLPSRRIFDPDSVTDLHDRISHKEEQTPQSNDVPGPVFQKTSTESRPETTNAESDDISDATQGMGGEPSIEDERAVRRHSVPKDNTDDDDELHSRREEDTRPLLDKND